nr:hypothetical protein [Micromonospora sp. DSM 115978]
MGLTARVLVTIGHVEGDFVRVELATPASGGVERPATGTRNGTLRCPACGRRFAVQVCSLAEASRRRRLLLGLALLAFACVVGVGLFIWFVAIRLDTAIPGLFAAAAGGLLFAATLTLLARAAFYEGVDGPWTSGVGHWLRRPVRDHRLTVQKR